MRAIFIFVFVSLLQTVNGQSQPSSPSSKPLSRWSLHLMIGPSIPIGKFAAKTIGDQGPLVNQVKPGIGAELGLNYRINPSFGLRLAIGGQDNPVTNYGDLLTGPEAIDYHVYHWQIARLLGGAQFSLPLSAGKGPVLLIRAMAGALKTNIPGYDVRFAFEPGNPAHHVAGTTLPWAFAYQAEAGIKWRISRTVFLLFDTGYAGATTGYEVGSSDVGFPGPPTRRTIPTGTLQLRAGAEIVL